MEHMLRAKASLPNLSEENVGGIKTALAAVVEFLEQHATRNTFINALTSKEADDKITTLNFNLDAAKSNLISNVIFAVATDVVTIKADVGRVEGSLGRVEAG